MQQKYYWIIGIIVLLAVIGIISLSPLNNLGRPEPQMALSPYVDFEATVISVSLDESGNYLEMKLLVHLEIQRLSE